MGPPSAKYTARVGCNPLTYPVCRSAAIPTFLDVGDPGVCLIVHDRISLWVSWLSGLVLHRQDLARAVDLEWVIDHGPDLARVPNNVGGVLID